MQKAFNNFTWENLPSTNTALEASRLNGINNALDTVDDRVVGFDTTKANQSDMLQAVKTVTFSEATGTFRFTFFNGTYVDVDTDIEKIAVNFDYDDDPTSAHFQQLVITLDDGTVKYVDMSALVTQYDFTDSSQIHFSVVNGNVTATVINGSITENMLQPNFLADCRSAKAGAESAESGAEAKALVAEGWATGTQNGTPVTSGEYYHNNAKYYKEQAEAFTPTGYEQLVNDVEELKEETAEKMVTPTNAVITDGIATFNTIDESYLKGLVVDIEPVQDLHGYDSPWVGGANENKADFVDGYSISLDGEVIEYAGRCATVNPITIEPDTTYYVKRFSDGGQFIYAVYNGSTVVRRVSGVLTGTALNTSGGDKLYVCAYDGTVDGLKPMVTKNSLPTAYSPYSNICPISGHTEVSVLDHGKNFVDIDNAINFEKYSGGIRNGFEFSDCKGTYTISQSVTTNNIYFAYQTTGGTWVESSISPSSLSATFSGVDGKIQIWVASGATIKIQSPYLQLEQGSTATDYEPYTGVTLTIPFGQTVYGGTLDVKMGVLTIEWGIVDLGTLNWAYDSTNTRFTSAGVDLKPPSGIRTEKMYCSALDVLWHGESISPNVTNGVIYTSVGGSVYAHYLIAGGNVNTFKAAMSGVQLCYPLATPTTIQLTPQQIKTLLGENNISASTGDVLSAIYTAMMTSADVETQIDALNIDDLQSAVADLQDDVSDIADDITAIDTRVTTLETNANKITWSSSVSALVDDTTATISDSHITTTSIIEPFYSNSSGDNVVIKNMVATTGQVVLTFDALLETTSFKVRITNL